MRKVTIAAATHTSPRADTSVAEDVDKQKLKGARPIRPEAKCLTSFPLAVSPGKRFLNFPNLSLQIIPTIWWLLGEIIQNAVYKIHSRIHHRKKKVCKKNVGWCYYNMNKERMAPCA